MRSLMFIILAGYAVRCNDASYYVIEMPEETQRQFSKPFRVYWNVPTMQCKSKRIPFDDLFDKFGIIQNSDDSFRGEKVSILYDPGLFPALLKNETSGRFKFRNGGVPQEGDLEKHLIAFRNTLEQSIPDENFSGIGIIDFESWRPVFRQNFGVLIPYKDISYQIERKLHWFWTERAIQARARQRFEEAGRAFMQTTLSMAKQLRPRGLWGYYGFPYCFNMAANNMVESCSDKVKQENDKISWLWSESTALYPSIYSSRDLSTAQLAKLVRGRVAEAARVGRGSPVLPYFWFRYREGGFLSQTDLDTVLETLYKSNASGFIIWGSSNDVNTVDKCNSLLQYTEEIMGPAIAKYTKAFLQNTTSNPVSNFGLTTWRPILRDHLHNSTTSKPTLDPEYHWIPPENYTQDIVHYVDQELKKKPGYNTTVTNTNETEPVYFNNNLLIEIILNIFKNDKEVTHNHDTEDTLFNNSKSGNEVATSTIAISTKSNAEYSPETSTQIVPNVVTSNPLVLLLKDKKKGTVDSKYVQTHLESKKTSNNKSDNKITTTTAPHTTRSYIFFTDKNNDSSEHSTYSSIDYQDNTTTMTVTELNQVTENETDILYDLIELGLNVSSVVKDSQENIATSTELSTVSANEDEIIDELLALGDNVVRIEHSTEVSKLSTYEYSDGITASNPTISSSEVTNTSQDYSDVTNTNLDAYSYIYSRVNFHHTTSEFTEMYTSAKPDKTLSTFDITQKDQLSKNRTEKHDGNATLENLPVNYTKSESVSEEFKTHFESSTSDYGDVIYDDSFRFSANAKDNDEYIPLSVKIGNSLNGTDTKDGKKGVTLEKYNQSTAFIISTDVEELRRSTTEEVTKNEVPDVEKEGFRIGGVTESGETTTDAQEVVVFL